MPKQSLVKSIVVKVDGNWKKTYQDVPAPVNSWKRINMAIDAILEQSVAEHTILHKPYRPVLVSA